jgi:hypothetical protein
MYQAMVFHGNPFNNLVSVRPIRIRLYKGLQTAIEAIKKDGHQGYIKKLGTKEPVWQNVSN